MSQESALSDELPQLLVLSTANDQRFIETARTITETHVMEQPNEVLAHLSVAGPCVIAATFEQIAPLATHPQAAQCTFLALWDHEPGDATGPHEPGPYLHVDLHGKDALLHRCIHGALYLGLHHRAGQRRRLLQQDRFESFIHTVNHDLRGPLQGILGLAGLLLQREGARLSAESRTWLTRIEDDAQRIADMVQSLSRYGRLGTPELKRSTFPLGDAVASAFERAASTHGERQSKLHVDDGLPQVHADRELLEFSIETMMDNALLYHPGPIPQIWVGFVHSEANSTQGWLEIHDDGIGIPEGMENDVFEMFRRGNRNYGDGLGVGLAFVKRIAELHQQDVSLAPSPKGGTVIRFGLDTAPG